LSSPDPYVALDVKIPSDVREIEHVIRLVTDQCHALHLPDRICTFNVPVALTEALANAILRGNRAIADAEVRLRTVVSADTLTFDVIDQGPGFDLDRNTREPAAGNLEREDGRGLFLMRELMDTVEQFHEPDDGNVVRMTIHR
jgi:serine/threonine-protein kinase RsbW